MVKRFSAWLLLMTIVFFSGCVNLHETVVTYQNDKYVSVIHFSISAEDDMFKEVVCSRYFYEPRYKMLMYQDGTNRFMYDTEEYDWYVKKDIIDDISINKDSIKDVYISTLAREGTYHLNAEEKEAFLDSFSYFNQKKNLTYKFYDVFNSQTSDYNKEYMEISVVFKDFPIKSRWHIASGLLKDGGIILGNSENNQLGICDGATFINENLWIQNVRNWVKAFD